MGDITGLPSYSVCVIVDDDPLSAPKDGYSREGTLVFVQKVVTAIGGEPFYVAKWDNSNIQVTSQ